MEGSTPAFMHAAMKPALVPKVVTPARSVSSQSTRMSCSAGEPSESTIAASVRRAPTRKFHIIQPVVVNQKIRSPSCRSRCR